MLGGSAPAGLSFLSKAARHSSGFTKSSEDETNPVASLCESCRQTAPIPLSFTAGGGGRQEVRLHFELLSIGGLVSIWCGNIKRKNQMKVAGSPWVEWALEMTGRGKGGGV